MSKIIKYFLLLLLPALSSSASAQLNWNKAGSFSGIGTNTGLSVANSAQLTDITQCMIGMWVYMNGPFPGYHQFFNKHTQFELYHTPSGLTLQNVNSDSRWLYGPILLPNKWYHIAVVIRDSAHLILPYKLREIYVDGVLAAKDYRGFEDNILINNTQPIIIGTGIQGDEDLRGAMDDIQMWAGAYKADDVARMYQTSLSAWGNSGNYYNGCILSIPFQKSDNSGDPFVIADNSRFNHSITNFNVTSFDLSARPSVTIANNLSVHLNGSSDYIAAPDHLNNSPDAQLTMEAWVYPEKTYSGGFSDFGTILCKGAFPYNYRMYLNTGNSIAIAINGNTSFGYSGDVSAPANRWTHIAFTYDGSNGNYFYYVNGTLSGSGANNIGNVTNGTDSLFIGKTAGGNFFQGYIDEVRIAGYAKTQAEINSFLYRAMDLGNRPGVFDLSCYNFDGGLANNNGGLPRLYFRNGAVFSSRYVPANKNFPVSPMLKADNFSFPNAWYISNNNFRVPAAGLFGSSRYDTINIPYCKGILDVNVFLALNHTYEQDLSVYLISPAGDSVELVKSNTNMERGHFITIFNDQADSSIVSDRFTSFLPNIKPSTSLSSVLTQKNTFGNWRLRVNDAVNGDTGMVYAWGLQFNNMIAKPNLMTLNTTVNQSGLWGSGSQIIDTVRIYLRNSSAPYSRVDSAIAYGNQFGFSTTYLANVLSNSYFMEIRHRNSLAIWSNIPKAFMHGGTTSQSFLSGPSGVYGGNMISVNGRWCMVSGDINQDDVINGNDFTVFNQQYGAAGYIVSDLNGDNIVNGNDFTIFNTGYGYQTGRP